MMGSNKKPKTFAALYFTLLELKKTHRKPLSCCVVKEAFLDVCSFAAG